MSDTSEKMHLKPEDIPEWVPLPVKRMAMAMGLAYEGTVAHRLLTDPRMKSVWRELKNHEITPDALASLEQRERMSNWDISDPNDSLQDQAYAAFYARVAIEFCSPQIVASRVDVKKSAKPWHDAAVLCWHVMRYEFRPKIDAEFAQALAIVGEYLERQGRLLENKHHGCDRIGGVVESVDEFEAERDEQRDAEKDERQVGGDRRAGRGKVLMDAIGREKEPECHDGEENQDRLDPHRLIKFWPGNLARRGRNVGR
jgi:hypothetical protein